MILVIRLAQILAETNVDAYDDAWPARPTATLPAGCDEPIIHELAKPVASWPIAVPIKHHGAGVQPIIRWQRDATAKRSQLFNADGVQRKT